LLLQSPPTYCLRCEMQTIGTFLDARAREVHDRPALLTAERLGPSPRPSPEGRVGGDV